MSASPRPRPRPSRARWPLACIALAASAWVSLPASGQVLRCTDPSSGKTSYTDGACPHGQRSLEVLPQQSTAEIAAERAQADRALTLKYQRQQQKTAQRAAEAARAALQRPVEPTHRPRQHPERRERPERPPPRPDYGYSPYGYYPPPPARPPAPAPRRDITHCNVFRCYDKNGNTYPIN